MEESERGKVKENQIKQPGSELYNPVMNLK
jgi:hypothetical protein